MTSRAPRLPRWMQGALFLGTLTTICGLAMSGLIAGLFAKNGEQVVALFRDTGTLAPGAPVRVNGIDSGKVETVELAADGRTARVEMLVYDDALPIHADARATIKYRTILGGNLAVELRPGRIGTLRERTIPASRTASQVELDDVTTALTRDARAGLRSTVRELSQTLSNTRAPAAAADKLGEFSPVGQAAARALRGGYPGELRTLIRNAERVVRAVDTPTDRVGALVSDAATTLAATADEQDALRQTLRQAPPTFATTRATVQRLDRTLALATPLLDKLRLPAADVAPTVRGLRPVLRGARDLLGRAQPLLRALRPASEDLAATARAAVPTLNGLDPSIDRVNREILPYLDRVDPVSERATYQMIGPTFAGVTGAAGAFDAEGRFFRFPAAGGANTFNTAPCQQFFTDPEATELANCDSLFNALNSIITPPERGRRKAGR